MVDMPSCAQCDGPTRLLDDGTLLCEDCDYEVMASMAGDDLRNPVLIERPGMFRSWSALGWFVLMLLLGGVVIACAVVWILR